MKADETREIPMKTEDGLTWTTTIPPGRGGRYLGVKITVGAEGVGRVLVVGSSRPDLATPSRWQRLKAWVRARFP